MLDPSHPLAKLLKKDRRYKLDAYAFVEEALSFAHDSLGMGSEGPTEDDPEAKPRPKRGEEKPVERHLTGQELCEAIRQFALDEYGYLAKSVLNSWGVNATDDFGSIVFNLIDIGRMKKTKQDRREDFHNVYSFDVAFRQDFKIVPSEKRDG